MTQKEEKEWTKQLPRFKDVCCKRMCKMWNYCKDKDNHNFLSCPWFHGYLINGWPVRRLSDFSYNAKPLPDLRKEEVSGEFLEYWKNRK